jgi:hypothetical protein
MCNKAMVLVDFDNIDYSLRTDLSALENRLFKTITLRQQYDEIYFRLYGGWDYKSRMSYSAQTIAPWIYTFPHAIDRTLLVAEMIKALAFENIELPYTFRRRSKNIDFDIDISQICVQNNSCDLFRMHQILKNKKCSKPGCAKFFNQAFLINEQKLVDTMIATDLHYFSSLSNIDIFLVSSDDDFIPPIRYLCNKGNMVKIIHTHPAPYRYKKEYVTNITSYIEERNL